MVHEWNQTNFDEELKAYDGLTLVDMYAVWCGPCRTMAPILEEIAKERDGQLKVAKVNIDAAQELASRYKVMSIPTFIIFKNGELVKKLVGSRSKEDLYAELDALK